MIQYNLTTDLSTLTQIPKVHLDKLFDIMSEDICECVIQSQNSYEDVISLNLSFGDIIIKVDTANDQILYKFVPSQKFEQMLVDTINNGESPLQKDIETSLSKKIVNLYKEML